MHLYFVYNLCVHCEPEEESSCKTSYRLPDEKYCVNSPAWLAPMPDKNKDSSLQQQSEFITF